MAVLDGLVPPLLIAGQAVLLTAVRRFYVTRHGRRGLTGDIAVIVAVVCLVIVLELEMGRTAAYQHGPVRLWSGDINSDQNSQQVFDPYTFTFLTLVLSLQASYAAPLILLAQNRQADRDRLAMEEDRRRAAMQKADTEFLARELASLRIALGEVATRDYLRSELNRLTEELDDSAHRRLKADRKEQRRQARRQAERADAAAFDEPADDLANRRTPTI